MACETHCCVLTRGDFYISDSGPSCMDGLDSILCTSGKSPLKKIGNVLSCMVNITSEILGTENKFNPVDSTCPRVPIQRIEMTLQIGCASAKNLYRALYGLQEDAETGVQVDEFCFDTLDECDFFPFGKLAPDPESIDVFLKDTEGLLVKDLILGTDYSISKSGIEIINPNIDVETGVTLLVSYNYDTSNHFEIKFGSKKMGHKTLYFKGTNYADGGEALFDAHFPKVLFKPIESFDLISGDEFFTLTLSGVVEKQGDEWFTLKKQEN